MRLIARKGKFVCALLTVILSGSLFTRVVFADDEPKTVPAGDEQPKKLGRAKTETGWQSDSAASETSTPQEPKRRALPAPLAYGLMYVPNVAQGMVIKFGRYISPPDIEAQLAPDNYPCTPTR
jgi:hypothetical protein